MPPGRNKARDGQGKGILFCGSGGFKRKKFPGCFQRFRDMRPGSGFTRGGESCPGGKGQGEIENNLQKHFHLPGENTMQLPSGGTLPEAFQGKF